MQLGGLIVANISKNFEEAVELSLNTIKDGTAFKMLERFVADTGDIQKLKRDDMMAQNILRKLVNNSQAAIDDGVYDVDADLQQSNKDFVQIIKTHPHATLLTEIKFASPSLGKIRTITNPVSIANQMIAGGSKALSVLTQPHLFNGSPEYFMQVRQAVDVPLLMKDIMIDKVQIDTAKKNWS